MFLRLHDSRSLGTKVTQYEVVRTLWILLGITKMKMIVSEHA